MKKYIDRCILPGQIKGFYIETGNEKEEEVAYAHLTKGLMDLMVKKGWSK